MYEHVVCNLNIVLMQTDDLLILFSLLQDKVKEQVISGNLDEPEGGFDALMQVAVCEKVSPMQLVYTAASGKHSDSSHVHEYTVKM